MRKTTFGDEIPEIREIVRDLALATYIVQTLETVLDHVGIENSREVAEEVLEIARNYKDIGDYEAQAHELLKREGVLEAVQKSLKNRAEIIYDQIKDDLPENGRILDLGCGDGQVGRLIDERTNLEVTLADVYRNDKIQEHEDAGLEFVELEQGQPVPIRDDTFDALLALTIYHHTEDPVKSIRENYRLLKPGGTAIIIESVHGVAPETQEEWEVGDVGLQIGEDFKQLTPEQQRLAGAYMDNFYNRVEHHDPDPAKKVSVTLEFNTKEGWDKEHVEAGFELLESCHYGMDQPTVPEWHTKHVMRKK